MFACIYIKKLVKHGQNNKIKNKINNETHKNQNNKNKDDLNSHSLQRN